MGTVVYRVTGIALSIITALLGAGVAVLLYYAGQDGLVIFYNSTYKDENGRIHKRMPTDDWYGQFVLRGWAFGFIYIVPGISGFTASLIFAKCPMVVHYVIGVLALVVGSLLHAAGVYALLLYQVFVEYGLLRYDTWPWDCKYIRYLDYLKKEYVDERCVTGRHASVLVIAAAGVAFVAWLFLLSDLLYRGFTFHNIDKDKKAKKVVESRDKDRPRRRPYRRRPPPPSESTASTNAATDGATSTPEETAPTFSTFQKGATSSKKKESHQMDTAVRQGDPGDSKQETKFTTDATAAPENVEVQEKGYITPL